MLLRYCGPEAGMPMGGGGMGGMRHDSGGGMEHGEMGHSGMGKGGMGQGGGMGGMQH
jgi:hypothetical protein